MVLRGPALWRVYFGGPAGARTGKEIENPRRLRDGYMSYASRSRRRFLICFPARALAGPPCFTISPPRGRPVACRRPGLASLEAMTHDVVLAYRHSLDLQGLQS